MSLSLVTLSKDPNLASYVAYDPKRNSDDTKAAARFRQTFLYVLKQIHSHHLPSAGSWRTSKTAATIASMDYQILFDDVCEVLTADSSVHKLRQWKHWISRLIALRIMTENNTHLTCLNILLKEAKASYDETEAGLLRREQDEDRANNRDVRTKCEQRLNRPLETQIAAEISAFQKTEMSVVLGHIINTIDAALNTEKIKTLDRNSLYSDLLQLPKPPGFKGVEEVEAIERKRKQHDIADDWLEDDDWL